MQISIQSLEVTYNKAPYRFIVKKVFNPSRNHVSFHCWAPEDNPPAKQLINNEVLMFEWDQQREELKHHSDHPVSLELKEAIQRIFPRENLRHVS
jgi:hypothetical protein